MGVGAVGNTNYMNHYQAGGTYKAGASFAAPMTVSSGITLNMTDEATGSCALTCVGFPNGGSTSVFKADTYSEENPLYCVKYWNGSGEETEYFVNPTQVNTNHASYIEMLAYTTYSDAQGLTSNAYGNFLQAAGGVNGDITYHADNICEKKDYMSMVKEFMQLQYDCNNLAGYLSFKEFYDTMSASESYA